MFQVNSHQKVLRRLKVCSLSLPSRSWRNCSLANPKCEFSIASLLWCRVWIRFNIQHIFLQARGTIFDAISKIIGAKGNPEEKCAPTLSWMTFDMKTSFVSSSFPAQRGWVLWSYFSGIFKTNLRWGLHKMLTFRVKSLEKDPTAVDFGAARALRAIHIICGPK
jgi:hypothetical protein